MAGKKVRSVFQDLYAPDHVAEMEMRAQLLSALADRLQTSRLTQMRAAKLLGVAPARIADLKRGRISRFRLALLVRLAARAGLRPKLRLVA
jgi:predicted XRE-type DNA-binding protein